MLPGPPDPKASGGFGAAELVEREGPRPGVAGAVFRRWEPPRGSRAARRARASRGSGRRARLRPGPRARASRSGALPSPARARSGKGLPDWSTRRPRARAASASRRSSRAIEGWSGSIDRIFSSAARASAGRFPSRAIIARWRATSSCGPASLRRRAFSRIAAASLLPGSAWSTCPAVVIAASNSRAFRLSAARTRSLSTSMEATRSWRVWREGDDRSRAPRRRPRPPGSSPSP